MSSRSSVLVRPRVAEYGWVGLWLACSIVPFVPFTFVLFNQALTNTPSAYLVWIPIVAFTWALRSLHGMPRTDKSFRGMRISAGLFCSVLVMSVSFAAEQKAAWLLKENIGLLLWGVWSTLLLLVLLGRAGLRVAWRPMSYLLMVWPPIYVHIVNAFNPILSTLAIRFMGCFRVIAPWVRPVHGTVYTVNILQGGTDWIEISRACSGSDSILALLVLFPFTFILIRGNLMRKISVTVLGCVMTFAMNLIRISLILTGLHFGGDWFAFQVLHPLLGPVVFIVIILLLMVIGARHIESKPLLESSAFGTAYRPHRSTLIWVGMAGAALTCGTISLYH